MSMRFSYQSTTHHLPLVSLGGRMERPRPVVAATLIGPARSWCMDSLLDTGADDTVFPEWVAVALGIDLTNAPMGAASGVGAGLGVLRYAQVTMRIADNQEQREWTAWVGFTAAKSRYPLLGFAGFLQFFTATFFGDREEVELTINSRYRGR